MRKPFCSSYTTGLGSRHSTPVAERTRSRFSSTRITCTPLTRRRTRLKVGSGSDTKIVFEPPPSSMSYQNMGEKIDSCVLLDVIYPRRSPLGDAFHAPKPRV